MEQSTGITRSTAVAGPGRAARRSRPWHRSLRHTSDLELEVGAPDLGSLLAEAARALAERLLVRPPTARGSHDPAPQASDAETRDLVVSSNDAEALLVDWLNELLFVAEVDLWVPTELDVVEATDTMLRVRARGVPIDVAPSKVKAATHHGLEIAERDGELVAHVILDL